MSPRAPSAIAWTGGGEASVVALDAGGIVLRSTVPSPPGSRIEGTLGGERSVTLRVKIHACRRDEDGTFELRGRPLDMTREVRQRVQAIVGV